MKSIGTLQAGTGLWNEPNYGAINASGFSAVPGGARWTFQYFNLNRLGEWWSSSTDLTFDDA